MSILIKIDSSYQMIWAKRYKALLHDNFQSIVPLSDGNFLVGGKSRQQFITQSGASIIKMDSGGNILWSKVYTQSTSFTMREMFEEADGSLRLFIRSNVNNSPIKLVHADSAGNMLSQRIYFRDSKGVQMEEVARGLNGVYYMAGQVFENTIPEFILRVCAINNTSMLWYKQFDFGYGITTTGISSTRDGNFVISGYALDTANSGTYNSWILKLDSLGNKMWAKEYSQVQPYNEFIQEIKETENGELQVFGSISKDTITDGLMMILDSMGNILSTFSYGNENGIFISSSYKLPGGGLFFNASSTDSLYFFNTDSLYQSACSNKSPSLIVSTISTTDTSYNITSSSPVLVEISQNFAINTFPVFSTLLCNDTVHVGIDDLKGLDELILFPVPAKEFLYFYRSSGFHGKLNWTLINSQGMLLKNGMLNDTQEAVLSIEGL